MEINFMTVGDKECLLLKLNIEASTVRLAGRFRHKQFSSFNLNCRHILEHSLTANGRRGTGKKITQFTPLKVDNLRVYIYDLFVAGMETTSSTLSVGVYMLAKHPHVQRRMQKELDDVVGRDRLPSFSDIERLPYVHATINEVQRTFNLAKMALPHMTSEDCKLGGYDIPKGTWLLANLDDALRSSEHWKNPLEFDPQNFLDDQGKYKKNDAFLPFGTGKRACVGEPLARMELFLFFSHLLQRFTFRLLEERKPLRDGSPMFNAPPDYSASVTCRPPK